MSASQQQSDAELLRLMLAGDEEAFTALYRRRQGSVYRFALRMSGSEALAEDVVQETFMVLMRDGGNFDPRSHHRRSPSPDRSDVTDGGFHLGTGS